MSADVLLPLGRLLPGGIFVFGGIRHYSIREPLIAAIGARGLPLPGPALLVASLVQVVSGGLLALGLFVGGAAAGLIAFTVAASVVMLNFWGKTGEERVGCQNAFLVNVGIVGGRLIAAAGAS